MARERQGPAEGYERAKRLEMSGCLALFRQTPDRYHDEAVRLEDSTRFAKRVNRPGRILERVEAGYDVEGGVGMRQLLHLRHPEITLAVPACVRSR